MKRRSVLRAGLVGSVAALLPRFAIGQSANARVMRFVPQANLTVLDPIVTTAAVTASHAWMVWDTLFGVDAAQRAKPQMASADLGRPRSVRTLANPNPCTSPNIKATTHSRFSTSG